MDNYLGEIRLFAFGMVPRGWHVCDGTLLPIPQNQALFALIGIKYGGNGTTNFGIPDLRGRSLVGSNLGNQDYALGSMLGVESVALNASQIPVHTHTMQVANTPGNIGIPSNRPAIPTTPSSVSPAITANIFTQDISSSTYLAADTLDAAGSNASHNNMQPFLTLNYCIAVMGTWPSRP